MFFAPVVKVDGEPLPTGDLVRGHDKPIHGSGDCHLRF